MAPKPKTKQPVSKPDDYHLSEARQKELLARAAALGEEVLYFPGRLPMRVRAMGRLRLAAERDAAQLVQAPFHGEPKLTVHEITEQRDRIELLRLLESQHQKLRASVLGASKQFEGLAQEASTLRDKLLRAFDLRFKNDSVGQKRLTRIRAGRGDADLVQDVSDLLILADEEHAYLATCPRGEAEAAARLKEISPQLSHLLGAKTLSDDTRAARALRDAAYTLITHAERRIRAAAAYWFGGTDRMKEYAVFTPPNTPGATDDEPPDPTGDAPTPNGAPAAPS